MENNIYTQQVTVQPPTTRKAIFLVPLLFLIGVFFLLPGIIGGFYNVAAIVGLAIGGIISVFMSLFLIRQRIKNNTSRSGKSYKKAVDTGISLWTVTLISYFTAQELYYGLDLQSKLNKNFMLSLSIATGFVLISLSLLALLILLKNAVSSLRKK